MSQLDDEGETADGSGWMKYYIWLGAVRFELPRPLTRWERFRCYFSPWHYEAVLRIPQRASAKPAQIS
jgi:hypothetical protein